MGRGELHTARSRLLEEHDLEGWVAADPAELEEIQRTLIETLAQFGIAVARRHHARPDHHALRGLSGERRARGQDRLLERDIARATRAERINILAPIPGKDTVGIEIAKFQSRKSRCASCSNPTIREQQKAKSSPSRSARMCMAKRSSAISPRCRTGSSPAPPARAKASASTRIIASILYRFTPEDLRLIMIDPKVVEMQMYNTLPHLVVPVVTDPKKVLLALRWAIDEMEKRYAIFAKTGVRNIGSFNARPRPKTQAHEGTWTRNSMSKPRRASSPSKRHKPPTTASPSPR